VLCVLATCSRATERLGKQLTRVSKPALSLIARNNLCQYLGVLNEADTLDTGPVCIGTMPIPPALNGMRSKINGPRRLTPSQSIPV